MEQKGSGMITTKKIFIVISMFSFSVVGSCEAVYSDGTVDVRNDGTYITVDR